MKRIFALIILLGIFGLACTISTGESATTPQVVTVLVQATALPTYTPYPTLAQATAIPYVAPTAKPKMGASDENTCALRFRAGTSTFYAISLGVDLAAQCPALLQQLQASDSGSAVSVDIVYTWPLEPIICQKTFDGPIQTFVVDTGSDTGLSQAFCGGLG